MALPESQARAQIRVYRKVYEALPPEEHASIEHLAARLMVSLPKCGPTTALELVAAIGMLLDGEHNKEIGA